MLEKLSVLGFDTAGVDQVQILKSRLTAASTLKDDYIHLSRISTGAVLDIFGSSRQILKSRLTAF